MVDQEKVSVFDELRKLPPEKREAALSFLMAKKTRQALRPHHASLELTPLCPLDCKMCYIKQEGLKSGAVKAMLDSAKWKRIIDQIAMQGLQTITLTGGEVFSYDAFFDVYEHAYDKGLEINLMSNAVLIDEGCVRRLVQKPPTKICVTLYGATAESYGRLCGSAAAFAKVNHAMDLMQDAGLPLILQSTITKDNVHELDAMIAIAEDRGLAYRYSANLFASRECTSACVAAEVTELGHSAERRRKIIDKIQNGRPLDREIVTHGTLCGAGRNSYHITWRGEMQPCILLDAYRVSVLDMPVAQAWEMVRDWTSRIPQLVDCQRCPAYVECGDHCLAAHYAEEGRFGVPALRRCVKRQMEQAEKIADQ